MTDPERIHFEFSEEPTDLAYDELIDYALEVGGQALLVVREDNALSEEGQRFMKKLEPFVVRRESGTEWPGTVLFDGSAELLFCGMTALLTGLLKSGSRRLFGWLEPDRPEDLCFLSVDGRPWLVSISHEDDGYIELKEPDAAQLLRSAPDLGRILRRQ